MGEFTIDIEQEVNRLGKHLQHLVDCVVPVEKSEYDFTPKCNIIESGESFTIKTDLPGLSKKEIHIGLKKHLLTIRGERVDELDGAETYRRQECSSGVFGRSFALPQNVDTSDVDATFRNGVLKITMSKTDVVENAKSISIS